MSLDNLKKQINEDAKKNAKKILEDATTQINNIEKETKEQIAQLENKFSESLEEEISRITNEYTSNTELLANNIIAEARSKVINEEFNKIKHALITNPRRYEIYLKIIDELINKSKQIMNGTFRIKAGKRYKTLILKKHPELKIDEADTEGIIISSADNKITIDATIYTIISEKEELIKKLIYNDLFNVQKPENKKRLKMRGK
ncbi:MAG: V-type ATP synthase subunit E [Candidatus Marsarchaeota archaeon]|jgi:Archaeal/vacuolar-type H+-ATPase subunit E|nr:V-type ATP synthase subunit E [Candidatus Marsarchaeota archaeon]